MDTFISPQDIDLLCNATEYDCGYNKGTKNGCSKVSDQMKESEIRTSKYSVFKKKCKALWSVAKEGVLGLVDVLNTITVLAKSIIGVAKIYKKMNGAFA